MNIRKIALGGAAAVAFAGLLSAAPASARTSHPATPAEMQQTDALNAQALATAQGNPGAAMPATTPSAPQASPTTPVTTAAATPLNAMPTAPTLTNAAVQGSDGAPAGMVNKVIIGTDGRPASVNVALSDNSKVVAIPADQLSFDSTKNILVASLTTEQIKSLPATSG